MSNGSGFFGKLGRFLEGIRRWTLNVVTLLVLVVLLLAIFYDAAEPVPDGGALVLNPRGVVVDEYSVMTPLEQLSQGDLPRETLLSDLYAAVTRAAADKRISMLVLSLNDLGHIGMSKTSELAPALQAFRDTGKPILAIADHFDQDSYQLALYADEIYTHPLGGVVLEGLSMYRNFYREALDKLAVEVNVFKAGEFKSAVEPYLRNDMSPESREANRVLIDQLWAQYRSHVTVSRNISPEQFDGYIDQIDQVLERAGGDPAQAAADNGLIDGIVNHPQWQALLKSRVGSNAEGDALHIRYRDYLDRTEPLVAEQSDKVAVVVVSGAIMPGESGAGTAGGDTIVKRIKSAVENDAVKAVVLRVDSPGGSVFASEQIRDQLNELRIVNKPLVVSMGSIAASGGYWIAAESAQIWATPATLTGSIGVFGALPNFAGSFKKLGIHTDGVATSEVAGVMRLDVPMSPVAKRALQSGVDFTYDKFLQLVSEGRQIPRERVDEIARGRVWSGEDALRLKLVDNHGGLRDAGAAAAKLAGLSAYSLLWIEDDIPAGMVLFQRMIDRVNTGLGGVALPDWLGRLNAAFKPIITELRDSRGLYALCAGCMAP